MYQIYQYTNFIARWFTCPTVGGVVAENKIGDAFSLLLIYNGKDKEDANMAERKGNITTQKNGFNVMVNLYIIRYLYRNMEKGAVFMDESGQRRKDKDFYVEINISRQLLNHIFDGRFILTKKIKQLSAKFAIEPEYFQTNGKYIQIDDLTEHDWKIFFKTKYKTDFKVPLTPTVSAENKIKIENALKRLVDANVIENTYSAETALFKVHYYWKNGVAYVPKSKLTKFITELQELKLVDWEEKEQNIGELKQYQKLLAKHADYLKKVIDYKEAKMNMQ